MSDSTMFGLDLRGKVVLAVGGGSVGTRRTRDLLARGARVRLVSPQLSGELQAAVDAGQIDWVPRVYAGPQDVSGAWLVHTATGVWEVDREVSCDAAAARIWCINASDVGSGTARTPARAQLESRDGPVDIAVTAGGDPGRASAVRASIRAAHRQGRIDTRARRRLLHVAARA